MHRLLLATIACLTLHSVGLASLSTLQKSPRKLEDKLPRELLARLAQDPAALKVPARAAKDEFIITDQTEIQCDGQPCQYADVPRGAIISLLEVAPDGKTVVKVHFKASNPKR